ncbi:MAG TPA: thiosulfate oxidation carrier complex protein SoxZ [Hyphomicrobiaceae bacterium]|nr:thiosulfate oxidation carrier complex protein SoxZ [Hyphomicrobiaceae bacterium]
MSVKPRIKVGDVKAPGDVVEVKTVIQHVMETGQRRDGAGKLVPRNIIHTFSASFAGKQIFKAELQPGISANPFISFFVKIPAAGDMELVWEGDENLKVVEKVPVKIG